MKHEAGILCHKERGEHTIPYTLTIFALLLRRYHCVIATLSQETKHVVRSTVTEHKINVPTNYLGNEL